MTITAIAAAVEHIKPQSEAQAYAGQESLTYVRCRVTTSDGTGFVLRLRVLATTDSGADPNGFATWVNLGPTALPTRYERLGDVDGDGSPDLYLGRGSTSRPIGDVILLNDGTGRRWRTIAVPGDGLEAGGSAVAFDHDGNGMADFVVLHGAAGPGPVRLIAAFPPDPAPSAHASKRTAR